MSPPYLQVPPFGVSYEFRSYSLLLSLNMTQHIHMSVMPSCPAWLMTTLRLLLDEYVDHAAYQRLIRFRVVLSQAPVPCYRHGPAPRRLRRVSRALLTQLKNEEYVVLPSSTATRALGILAASEANERVSTYNFVFDPHPSPIFSLHTRTHQHSNMSFHESAQEIVVEDGHILKAQLASGDDWVDAEFDLNTVLGNSGGSFEWGGENFADSAEDISFELEGDDGIPVLRASLGGGDDERYDADINLSEHIANVDGEFQYTG
ncbi:hypothetical protein NM208_g1738 [Fusarium decemcellulare]|uniref:Uncharacterized protein n=1 Tax=Fusarium decemcellulare TaxID=57161 RepID=A0ACC1SV00_9HYPO|nr:hypothetical protein NM208_g1738 [Fusarium decemcellulare]